MKASFRLSVVVVLSLVFIQDTQAQVMPSSLPGVDGAAGTVGVTDFFTGDVLKGALDVGDILDGIADGSIKPEEMHSAQFITTDVTEPFFYPDGGPVISSAPHEYPSGGFDDLISVMKGAFRVAESGTYTVQVHSDDGFALRVNGSEFTSVYGNGVIDADDPQTIFHETNTVDSNTRGVIELSAGVHTFDAFTWNSLEGAYMEISSAKGEFPYHKASWLAIGDDSVVPEQTLHPIAKLTGPMFVGNLNDAFDQELDLERDNLLAAQAGGTLDATHDTSTTFHMDDDRFALSCPFSENPEFHAAETTFQWPNTDGDINNFASIMTGSFVVDDRDGEAGETIPVSFHIDSDGRSSFRVIGQDFDAVMDDELVELDGDDSMFANRGVCNTNYTGTITLTEGVEYDFEAIHVEGSGDSGMQLLVAPGDHVDEFDKSAFVVVGTEAFVIPENLGLALVDPSGGIPGDFDGDEDLDADDIDLLSLEVEAMTNNVAFELTGDNLTNAADRTEWVETLKETFFGDANLDNSVTFEDFLVLSNSFGGAGGWALGDFDGDGNIAFADFLLLSNSFGSSAQAASAVPEPASWYLFGLGSLIIFARIKRSNP